MIDARKLSVLAVLVCLGTVGGTFWTQELRAGVIADVVPGLSVTEIDRLANSLEQQPAAEARAAASEAAEGVPGASGLRLSESASQQQLLISAAAGGADATSTSLLGGGTQRKRRNSGGASNANFGGGSGSGGSSAPGSTSSGGFATSGSGVTSAAGNGSGSGSNLSNGGSGTTASNAFSNAPAAPTTVASTSLSANSSVFSGAGAASTVSVATSSLSANLPAIGTEASNPILPSAFVNGSYVFNFGPTTAGTQVFFDPPIAPGYIFTAIGPNFTSFTIAPPTSLPNTPELFFQFNGSTVGEFSTSPGSGSFDTFTFPSGGVSTFTLFGISALDVNGQEFNFSFTYAPSTVGGSFTQTPLAFPEPGSLSLLTIGAIGLLGWRRTRGTKPLA